MIWLIFDAEMLMETCFHISRLLAHQDI